MAHTVAGAQGISSTAQFSRSLDCIFALLCRMPNTDMTAEACDPGHAIQDMRCGAGVSVAQHKRLHAK